jgi:hypothetical protein
VSGRRGESSPATRMIAGCASRREKREGYVAEMAEHQEMRVGPLLHSRGELLTRMARAATDAIALFHKILTQSLPPTIQ